MATKRPVKRTPYAIYLCNPSYGAWHDEAERRGEAGDVQVLCNLGRYYFPTWVEDRAQHRGFHKGATCNALTMAAPTKEQ